MNRWYLYKKIEPLTKSQAKELEFPVDAEEAAYYQIIVTRPLSGYKDSKFDPGVFEDKAFVDALKKEALSIMLAHGGQDPEDKETKKLIDKKQLSNLAVRCLILKHSEANCKMVASGKYQDEIGYLVASKARNNFIRNLALKIKGNTLCLFQLVEKHGRNLFEIINDKAEKDRKVFYIYGGVEAEEREKIRAIVEKENNAIIVASYGTFSTGINIKNLHNIIFASPSKSRIRNLQSIGRGLRLGDNKVNATLYDIADDLQYKSKENFTLKHFQERINIYTEEEFDYEIHNINLKD